MRFISTSIRVILCLSLVGVLCSPVLAAFTYRNALGGIGNGFQFVTFDKGCQAWVCDYSNNRIRVFHPNGYEATFSPISIGKTSAGVAATLYNPSGVSMDTAGIIYVTCDNNGTGGQVFKFQSWDGIALNGFDVAFRPGDLDIDNSNNVFIVEKVAATGYLARFHVTDTTGTELTNSPVGIAGTSSVSRGVSVTRNSDTLYIANEASGRILKFVGSVTGSSVSYSTTIDFATGLGFPNSADVDNSGRVYVCTTTDNSVRIYDADGSLRETLSGNGLTKPRGVGLFPNNQVLYIAQFIAGTNILQRWTEPVNVQIPVIGYHNVTTSINFGRSMTISPDIIGDELDFLVAHGYHVVNLDSVYNYWMNGVELPANPIVFTFDDNYFGEYGAGGPLFKARGLNGTIFAHTNYVGTAGKANWTQLIEGETNNYMYTASHTKTHTNWGSVNEATAIDELEGSKLVIETNMPGKTCRFLAYPYGTDGYLSSSPYASRPTLAAKAGYLTAYSYAGGFSSRTTGIFCMPRITGDGGDTISAFKTKIGFSGSRISTDFYIVNDETTIDGTCSLTGSWTQAQTVSGSVIGCYGNYYRYTAAGSGAKYATFTPTIQQSGLHNVYVWWNADTDRGTNVPVTVTYASGTFSTTVNQQTNGFQWIYIGQFQFNAGTAGNVKISDNANGVVTADAVKFTPVFPAVTCVDNFNMYQ